MLHREMQDEVAGMGIALARHHAPAPVACLIANGTFDPKTDTAEVHIGAELIRYDDDGNLIPADKIPTFGPFPIINVPGQQKGVVGGERCFVIPVDGGGIIALASYDDAPGIDAGEWMQRHQAHPDSQFYLKNDGTAVHSAETRAIVTAPRVCLGEGDSSGNDGVMRESDGQKLADDLKKHVQDALNQLARIVQLGSGVAAPTIEQTTAQGSSVTFSA